MSKIVEIEPTAVKPGDEIRVTVSYPKGTEYINTGIVSHSDVSRIYSVDKTTLWYADQYSSKSVIELLSRPRLPIQIGTVLSVELHSGGMAFVVRVEKTSDEDEMVWLELAGTGDTFHTENEFKSWTEMELVAKD